MGHWSFSEMQQAFGWNAKQYVWFGGYPASVSLIEDEERWKAYITDSLIETTLTRDILLMSRLDKPALLRQLFELGSLYSGQILSFSKIMGQLQDAGNTTTLSHYLNLLGTAGLLGGLEKYSPNMIRKRSSSPKFQVYNNALVSSRHSENFSSIQINPSEWGRIVESAVGAHLINHAQEKKFQLYYWRERNEEVDYILERKGSIIALEVKTSYSKMPSGMNSFQKKFSPDKVFMVGSNGIPWEEFLKIDPLTLF
jgi:predicted AAA+ superfamily ATPase